MYKYLIVGIALMFVVSGGYYMSKAGGLSIIISALTSDKPDNFTPPSLESIVGVYVCDIKSGCNNKYVLLLRGDQTAELVLLPSSTLDDTSASSDGTGDASTTDGTGVTTQGSDSPISTDNQAPTDTTSNPDVNTTSSSSDNTDGQAPQPTTQDTSNTDSPDQTTDDSTKQALESLLSGDGTNVGSTSLADRGTWNLGVQNMLVVTLKEKGTTTYDVPQKLVVKNIGATTLSRISYTKSNYKDMIKPTFIKQE